MQRRRAAKQHQAKGMWGKQQQVNIPILGTIVADSPVPTEAGTEDEEHSADTHEATIIPEKQDSQHEEEADNGEEENNEGEKEES